MPTSTTPQPSSRRSSVGPAGRRGPQKAHVPYRADDLEQTKKTGIQVAYVDHKSDDFEPFDEVLQQADGRTPARKKRKSHVKAAIVQEDEDDEYGEMSMVTDNSGAASPGAYFSQKPRSPTPSARRVLGQSSSRPVPRGSSVDFDSVPSPKSVRPRASGAGPSNLRRSTVAADLSADMDVDDHISRRTSFSALGGDDDEEEERVEEEIDVTTPVKDKTKAKSKSRQPSPPIPESPDEHEQGVDMDYGDMDLNGGGMEDDIEHGLHDVDDNDSGSEEEVPAPKKKGKAKQVEPEPEEDEGEDEDREPTPKPKKTRVKREKHIPIPDDDDEHTDTSGVRRSQRHRYAPLAFWRQEKVVYGRREHGISFVPHIKEIIRIPQEEPQRLGKQGKRKRARSTTRGKSEDDRKAKGNDDEVKIVEVWNPEEGWDDETNPVGTILDFVSGKEVQKRIAAQARTIDPKPAANSEWFFQKVFGDGEFIAAGQLRIPPNGRKPSKGTKDNTYIFYIIEGAVNLKVHETNMVLATGAMFIIPRGNTYFIENIGERDAKLFFTQARKVAPETDDEGTIVGPRRSSESMPPSRRASTGAPPSGGGGAKLKRAASTKV
ncbi:hypothetical protein HWV62_26330 [Athelia sp. TMB]|nr:hypothetical protein HWV62_26330 [Athelia sp. TMB]